MFIGLLLLHNDHLKIQLFIVIDVVRQVLLLVNIIKNYNDTGQRCRVGNWRLTSLIYLAHLTFPN